MPLAAVEGVIRRRILISFRVDPEVMQRQLPPPLRPKRLGDAAIAGLCLIWLEQVRPRFMPLPMGAASENAAHRVAVCWTDEQGESCEGVYVARRDTSSLLNHLTGGRLFPGAQHRSRFHVRDDGEAIDFSMEAADGAVIRLRARPGAALPATSRFPSMQAASDFYEAGSLGFSASRDGQRLEGVTLCTRVWRMEPLVLESVYSSYFADERRFPRGSVELDSAVLMRDIPHEWRSAPGLDLASTAPARVG